MSNQANRSGPPSLFRLARRLVYSWWQSDRIRVSPSTGQLLQLRPPCWLCLEGQYVEVVDRMVCDDKLAVVYRCRTHGGLGTLVVELDGPTADVSVQWHEGGRVMGLTAAEVEVFPA